MSTVPTPPVTPPAENEIRIYSHSPLFYWWPVWAVSGIMGILTFFGGYQVAFVPTGTVAERERNVSGQEKQPHDVLIVLPDKKLPVDAENKLLQPHLLMSPNKSLGVLFAVVLLIIIFVSNIPLRGYWSVIVVLLILLASVFFAFMGWWDKIYEYFSALQIHINEGGYFFIGVALLIIWSLTFFVFDHRTYVVVTTGQVRVCLAVGAGETVYDTTGMTFSKRQDDLFRHWILGFGSGDLIIHRTATSQEIDMPNVLFVSSKVRAIEELIKERRVVG